MQLAKEFAPDVRVKAWKNIWGAGHAVGQTHAIQTTAEIVDELVDDFERLRVEKA